MQMQIPSRRDMSALGLALYLTRIQDQSGQQLAPPRCYAVSQKKIDHEEADESKEMQANKYREFLLPAKETPRC